MHGHFPDVLQNITDSYARDKALTRFARVEQAIAASRRDLAQREAALTSRQVEAFCDACDNLTARLDAFEQRRADRLRRDEEEMAARAAEYIASLPDPDVPGPGDPSQGDDVQPGSSELVTHPPVSEEHLGVPDTPDGATGALPGHLDLTENPNPTSHQQNQPVSISLW
jgi:hypothetical protein